MDGEVLVEPGFGQELLMINEKQTNSSLVAPSTDAAFKELVINTETSKSEQLPNGDYLQTLVGLSPNPTAAAAANKMIDPRSSEHHLRTPSLSIDDQQAAALNMFTPSLLNSSLNTSLNISQSGNYLSVTKRKEDQLAQDLYNNMFSQLNYPLPTTERIADGYKSKNENEYRKLVGKSVLNVEPFTRDILRNLFDLANVYKSYDEKSKPMDHILRGKRIGCLFYENSTRTRCSFEAATKALGGQFNGLSVQTSSVAKGESFEDTVSMMSNYNHLLIIRHNEPGAMERAAKITNIPIINAGDGIAEHPTQSLLDVFTIKEERGTVNGLVITFVGDLKHGRTVHSLAKLLTNYRITRFNYVSPPNLKMPQEIRDLIERKGITQQDYETLEEVLPESDVLYMTRIQKERFSDETEFAASYGKFILTPQLMHIAKKNLVVMHPLPRNNEIR